MLHLKFKTGVEAEFLIMLDDPVSAKSIMDEHSVQIPHDDFDLLAEARSEPSNDPNMVWGSLEGDIERIKSLLPDGIELSNKEYPFDVDYYWQQVLRCNTSYGQYKGSVVGGNVYGHSMNHESTDGIIHRGGGLHLHFSASVTISGTTNYLYLPCSLIERVTRILDDKYSKYLDGCQNSYRQPGFWRRKSHGFEYRSLPASSEVMDNVRGIIRDSFAIFKKEMTRQS